MAKFNPPNRPNQPQQQQVLVGVTLEAQHHSGPLPSPEVLAGYEKAVPGGALRILQMAETEQQHRHWMQRRQLWLNSFHIGMGQISGLLIGALGIGGGVWLVYTGKSLEGLSTFLVSLGVLTAAFFFSQKRDKSKPNPSTKEPVK